ncbi:unnamed protein product [Pleuronectes platessa]|uniref:Uncharacterized protein n=1 Tax=Pleuronectes platessa TaxID=8262 RepID=A0A9N7VF57_PLEPL|nr:unnamed protein product [Pleuronectes platessa]
MCEATVFIFPKDAGASGGNRGSPTPNVRSLPPPLSPPLSLPPSPTTTISQALTSRSATPSSPPPLLSTSPATFSPPPSPPLPSPPHLPACQMSVIVKRSLPPGERMESLGVPVHHVLSPAALQGVKHLRSWFRSSLRCASTPCSE